MIKTFEFCEKDKNHFGKQKKNLIQVLLFFYRDVISNEF